MADLDAPIGARPLRLPMCAMNRFALAEQALRQRCCGLGQAVRVGLPACSNTRAARAAMASLQRALSSAAIGSGAKPAIVIGLPGR